MSPVRTVHPLRLPAGAALHLPVCGQARRCSGLRSVFASANGCKRRNHVLSNLSCRRLTGVGTAMSMVAFGKEAAASQSQDLMKAVSAAPDLEALGNLGGAFMHPMQWFQGLRMASIELVSLGDLQTPDLLSPDRIALAAIGIVLGILYFQKAQEAGAANSQLEEASKASQAASNALRTTKEEKDALQQELASARQELASAQQQAANARSSAAEASESYARAAESLADTQKTVQRLTSTLEGVSDAREQLEVALEAAKAREHEVTEQLTSTAASVVALKAQAASASEEAEALRTNLQLLKQEYRVNALNMEDKIDALAEQGRVKDGQLASAQEASAQLRAQLSEQSEKLAQTQKFLRTSQAEAADLLADLRAAEDAQDALQENIAALEAKLQEAKERSKAAAAQLASQQEAAATLEKARAAAVQDAREMLAELRELKFALEESNEAAASLQSELAAAKEEAASLVAQLESSKQEVEQLSAESREVAEHLQSELATAQEHAASLAAELASSKKEQERLRAEAAAAAQDARESLGRETDIQEQLQRADQVIEDLQAKLEQAEKGALIAQSQAQQLSEAEHKVVLLEDELEKTRTAAKGDIRRLSVELQGLRDEHSQLAQQASRINEDMAEAQSSELQEAQAEISRLNAQLAAAKSAVANGGTAQKKGRVSSAKARSAADGAPVDQGR